MDNRKTALEARSGCDPGPAPGARGDAASPGRRSFSDLVSFATARTLYNVIDARWPEHGDSDRIPVIEQALRHAGPKAACGLWFATRVLDYEPLLWGPVRRRFWRLPRAQRLEATRRWERSHLRFRRASFAWLAACIEAQSFPGA